MLKNEKELPATCRYFVSLITEQKQTTRNHISIKWEFQSRLNAVSGYFENVWKVMRNQKWQWNFENGAHVKFSVSLFVWRICGLCHWRFPMKMKVLCFVRRQRETVLRTFADKTCALESITLSSEVVHTTGAIIDQSQRA